MSFVSSRPSILPEAKGNIEVEGVKYSLFPMETMDDYKEGYLIVWAN